MYLIQHTLDFKTGFKKRKLYLNIPDVKEEMLFGPDGERGGETQEREMKTEASRLSSPHGSVDSPDHIDVVNTFHSPPHTSSSPPPEPFPASSNSPPRENSPPFSKIVVKVEREENGHHGNDDGHHSNALGDSGSPPADQSATQGLVRHLQLPSDVLYLKVSEAGCDVNSIYFNHPSHGNSHSVCVCVCACVRACVRACVCVCVCIAL